MALDIEKYAQIGPQYYNFESLSPFLREIWAKYNNKIETVLDSGCGDGSLLNTLQAGGFLTDKKTIAIDLSKARINLIKQNIPGISAMVDNVEELKAINNESIDLYISTQVIEHVDNQKMINQIKRVVRPGGLVYISTVFKNKYGWYFHRSNGKWVLDPTHLIEYTDDSQLLSLFNQTDFILVDNQKAPLSYPIIDCLGKKILKSNNRNLFNNPVGRFLRRIKVPIYSYFIWELAWIRR